MGTREYPIPERIISGDHYFLNCEVGESVRPNNQTDKIVLNKIEEVSSGSYLQLYYKYPDTGPNDSNDYVDIVALTPKFGCLTIMVYDFKSNDITNVQGPDWNIKSRARSIRPTTVSGDAGVGVRRIFEDIPELRNRQRESKIPVSDFVAIPHIPRDEWPGSDSPPSMILFKDDFSDRESLTEKISPATNPDISSGDLRNALAALRFSDSISGGQLNVEAIPQTKRELLDFIDRRLRILTNQQMKIGLQIPDAPQQIRGIAGSGKTVVSAFRAAHIHQRHPEWDIAVTFRTHGLHQIHRKLIRTFYHRFSNGDEPNWGKLRILHDWGGKNVGPGMYSTIAEASGESALSADQARRKFGRFKKSSALLDSCCADLLQKTTIPDVFDVIIIDEAQDLPTNFFRMAYKAASEEKRLYWSYDEAQNLTTLEAQSPEALFGTDTKGNPLVDVSGFLPNRVPGTHVMRKSFRTPRSVLMTAYGFGMGMYRDGPLIQTITNERGWNYLGFEVESGDFQTTGSEIIIKRPIENSPHPAWDREDPSNLVNLNWSDDWREEVRWVARDIRKLVGEEDILPEEILITHLWPYKLREERIGELSSILNDEISEDIPSVDLSDGNVLHIVGDDVRRRGTNSQFKKDGKISLSSIHYVGGNEANIVYLIGTEYAGEDATREQFSDKLWRRKHVEARNRLFVAITRTKAWCRISGADPTHDIVGELNRVKDDTLIDDPKLRFNVPPSDSPYKEMEPELAYQSI